MTTATKTLVSTAPIYAVLPAVDAKRAESFYRDVVGLEIEPLEGTPGYFFAHAGKGTRFLVYEREGTKAEHTVASFEVEDIESVVRELRERGVVFEEYDMPGLKTVNGIASMGPTRSAWFRDTEGNIIGIATGM
jgi:predicted enzyme related to lactoylglutathione lyase